MNTLNSLALIAHVLIAASIIGLVMLQKGKGADAGAGFGAGASGTVFGARGSANFLSRSTAVMAALFFTSSMGLAYLNRNVEVAPSLLDKAVVEENIAIEFGSEGSRLNDSAAAFDLPPLPEVEETIEVIEPAATESELPVVPETAD
jgi:preprotein translocase subunit SecG